MAISLVVEVLDHAPRELTQAELVVLVVLAEQAREATRECWPGMELICHRSRLQEDSVRKVFQRLAARGLEVRVPVGKSRSGQPIYAHHGARTLYRIPRFAPPTQNTQPVGGVEAGTPVPPSTVEAGMAIPPLPVETNDDGPVKAGRGSRKGGTSSSEGRTSVPPFPSLPQIPSPTSSRVSGSAAAAAPHPNSEEDRQEGAPQEDEHQTAAVVLLAHLDLGRPLRSDEAGRLLEMIVPRLRAGWPVAQLRDTVSGDWGGVNNRVAVLHARLEKMSMQPPTRTRSERPDLDHLMPIGHLPDHVPATTGVGAHVTGPGSAHVMGPALVC
ncbi:helix-turn-helix domain-containing protein [Actinocrinis puniceicyclus]|uniref:Helix-turn-helix domain-containing protein n=1 Tax=Actinocrinis puniceicyclus TaxID=977794 RepID=A0A8J8BD84_9ACTN|nr:helix-turn-helix domain-containing protein [Actinocrinis puniceicyclus]MBS2963816.1 helix-turn-helix domain-containing protein [Actinocrinis puniceicyclus]